MRIGLDIDGCIYPWTQAANETVAERFGVHDLGEHRSWNYLKEQLTREQFAWLWTREAAEDVFGRDLMYAGAWDVVQALCDSHQVHFVTHRHPEYAGDITAAYIAANFHGYKGLHVLRNGISKASLMGWDVFVDDKLETLEELVNTTSALVLAPARPWNKGAPCPRFEGWPEVLDAIGVPA